MQENTMFFEVSSNRLPSQTWNSQKKIKKTRYFSQYFLGSRNVDTTSGRTMWKKRRFFNGFQRSLIKNIRFFRVFRCRFPRAPPPGTRQLCLIKRNNLAVAQKQNCCPELLWRLLCCNLLDGTVSARPGPTQRGPTRPGPTRGSSLLVSLLKVSEAIRHALICYRKRCVSKSCFRVHFGLSRTPQWAEWNSIDSSKKDKKSVTDSRFLSHFIKCYVSKLCARKVVAYTLAHQKHPTRPKFE